MNIKVAIIGVLVVLLASGSAAMSIGVGIQKEVDADLKIISTEAVPGAPASWTIEASNPGSTRYTGRIHLTIRNGSETVFRTSTDQLIVPPGGAMTRTLRYFDPKRSGELNATFTLRYGDEYTSESVVFATAQRETRPGIELVRTRTYPGEIQLRFKVPEDVSVLHVSAEGNPTWSFAQVDSSVIGRQTTASISVSPKHIGSARIKVHAFDEEGRYYHTETASLTELSGWDVKIGRLMGGMSRAVHATIPRIFIW